MRFLKNFKNTSSGRLNFFHKTALLIFLAGFFITDIPGQIKSVEQLTQSCRQYKTTEWVINLKTEWTDPYLSSQIEVDMILESPSSKKISLPCFYYKGKSSQLSEWRARFTPVETGAYKAVFRLRGAGISSSLSDTISFPVLSSGLKGFLHPNDLWTLKFDNGELFRGLGENICWEARKEDDSKYFKKWHENKKFNYADMLTKLKRGGGNFFRTWMIYWNLPVDWKNPKNSTRYKSSKMRFNESGIKRMDELIELCDSLEMYLMLALDSHVGYMGSGWENSSYNKKNGGFAESPLEFFSSNLARQQYKDKLRYMVARWGYSKSIACWEFFNEIDNAMYAKDGHTIPDSIITGWHTEMSAFLKQIDPYGHIVTTSISHRDVAGLNDIKTIDINQKHIYRYTKGIPETIRSYTDKFHKPYAIGEFGYEWDWSKDFNAFAEDMDSDYKRGLWYGLFSPTPILPMSWWWEFFDKRNMTKYFANVREMQNNIMQSGKGIIEQINVNVTDSSLVKLGVTNGVKNYAYIYNPGEKEITCKVSLTGSDEITFSEIYNCESAVYCKLEMNNILKTTIITIPAKTDIVLIGYKK